VCGWAQPVRRAPPAVVSILSATPVDAAQIPSSTSGSSQHTNPAGDFGIRSRAAEYMQVETDDEAAVGVAGKVAHARLELGAGQDVRLHFFPAHAGAHLRQPTGLPARVQGPAQVRLVPAIQQVRAVLVACAEATDDH